MFCSHAHTICVHRVHKAEKRVLNPRDWRYRQLWEAVWVLESWSGPSSNYSYNGDTSPAPTGLFLRRGHPIPLHTCVLMSRQPFFPLLNSALRVHLESHWKIYLSKEKTSRKSSWLHCLIKYGSASASFKHLLREPKMKKARFWSGMNSQIQGFFVSFPSFPLPAQHPCPLRSASSHPL